MGKIGALIIILFIIEEFEDEIEYKNGF